MAIKLPIVAEVTNKASTALKKITSDLKQISADGSVVGKTFTEIGDRAERLTEVGARVFKQLTDSVKEAIQVTAEYDFIITQITGALTGLDKVTANTTLEMKALNTQIFDLAIVAGISNREVAIAATELTQAGFALDDTAIALENFIQLATVEGQSFDAAAGSMISAMRTLGLTVADTGEIVDVFAAITLSTALDDFKIISRSFGLASAEIKRFGISIRDAGAILGVFADISTAGEGGIEAMTLVGNVLQGTLAGLGENGLLAGERFEILKEVVGDDLPEGAGKAVIALTGLRKLIADFAETEEEAAEVGLLVAKAFGLSDRSANILSSTLTSTNGKFEELTAIINKQGIAQENFEEIASSLQRRLGGLKAVVEQLQIVFISTAIEELEPELDKLLNTLVGGEEGLENAERLRRIVEGLASGVGELAPALNLAAEGIEAILTQLDRLSDDQLEKLGQLGLIVGGSLGAVTTLKAVKGISGATKRIFSGPGSAGKVVIPQTFNPGAAATGIGGLGGIISLLKGGSLTSTLQQGLTGGNGIRGLFRGGLGKSLLGKLFKGGAAVSGGVGLADAAGAFNEPGTSTSIGQQVAQDPFSVGSNALSAASVVPGFIGTGAFIGSTALELIDTFILGITDDIRTRVIEDLRAQAVNGTGGLSVSQSDFNELFPNGTNSTGITIVNNFDNVTSEAANDIIDRQTEEELQREN